jgi:hypothetical protein
MARPCHRELRGMYAETDLQCVSFQEWRQLFLPWYDKVRLLSYLYRTYEALFETSFDRYIIRNLNLNLSTVTGIGLGGSFHKECEPEIREIALGARRKALSKTTYIYMLVSSLPIKRQERTSSRSISVLIFSRSYIL